MISTPAVTTERVRNRHRRLRWLLAIGLGAGRDQRKRLTSSLNQPTNQLSRQDTTRLRRTHESTYRRSKHEKAPALVTAGCSFSATARNSRSTNLDACFHGSSQLPHCPGGRIG